MSDPDATDARARIVAAINDGSFLPDDDAALGGAASVVAFFGDGDIARFVDETGIPASLGLLLDRLIIALAGPDRPRAREFTKRFFRVAADAGDLTTAPAGFAIWLFDRAVDGREMPAPAATVRALHLATSEGRSPGRGEWAAIRAEALADADAGSEPPVAQLHELAAALAWPTDRSRTVLAEGLSQLAMIEQHRALAKSGWTPAVAAECDATMHRVWEDTVAIRDADPQAFEFPPISPLPIPIWRGANWNR